MQDTIESQPVLSLDQIIEALQALRAAGHDGSTPVTFPTTDNNLNPGFMQRIGHVGVTMLSRGDFDKGFVVCKAGRRDGVPAVILR